MKRNWGLIFEEEINTIRNANDSVLKNFSVQLDCYLHDQTKQDYVTVPYLPEIVKYHSYMIAPPILDRLPLTLFSLYRLSSKIDNDEKLKNFECDCCCGVTKLYRKVYSWLKDFICESIPGTTVKYQLRHTDKNILFKGDTMTSIFTPIKKYIKLKSGIQCTTSKAEEWELYWLRNIWNINISEYALDFIWHGYSFANFHPVPKGFNRGRSRYGEWDSWDLTLNQIYQWYLDNPQIDMCSNNRALAELFKYSGNKEEVIFHCTEWLKTFRSWGNFVEKNYMQPFLLPSGCPKRFFENHTLEYGLPKTLDEYEEFFENAVSCMKKRGNVINDFLNIE